MVRPTKLPWKRDPPVTWVAPKREPSWRILVSPRRKGSWQVSACCDSGVEFIVNVADSQGRSSGRCPSYHLCIRQRVQGVSWHGKAEAEAIQLRSLRDRFYAYTRIQLKPPSNVALIYLSLLLALTSSVILTSLASSHIFRIGYRRYEVAVGLPETTRRRQYACL